MCQLILKPKTHAIFANKTLNQGFQNANHATRTKKKTMRVTTRLQELQKKLVKAKKKKKKKHATVLADSLSYTVQSLRTVTG